jgi:hypothetical protein
MDNHGTRKHPQVRPGLLKPQDHPELHGDFGPGFNMGASFDHHPPGHLPRQFTSVKDPSSPRPKTSPTGDRAAATGREVPCD